MIEVVVGAANDRRAAAGLREGCQGEGGEGGIRLFMVRCL